jgi:NAD(P)-dependent dehydrogenase (short-subunit alcohol dehydrogenase family)
VPGTGTQIGFEPLRGGTERRPVIARLNGKVALVSGGARGIGAAAAREMIAEGAKVVIGDLLDREGRALAKELGPSGTYVHLDVTKRGDWESAVATAERSYGRLDVLVNNAGAVSTWYMATEDGFETQFAVNHLAPFLLTRELLPALRRADWARVITTSSGSHFHTRMRWDDLMLRRRYSCLAAYKQSKLAEVLFTNELNRRLGAASTVRAYAVDPGLVDTSIGEKGTSGLESWIWRMRRRSGISPEAAAATIVHLAMEPELEDRLAGYWKECRPASASPYASAEAPMRRLWEVSERLCGAPADVEPQTRIPEGAVR